MNAGKLDQRITIQRETRTSDGMGGGTVVRSTLKEVWAQVVAISGRERQQAQQIQSPSDYRITIRRDSTTSTITTADRIIWRTKTLNIRYIADNGPRATMLVMDCEEGVPS